VNSTAAASKVDENLIVREKCDHCRVKIGKL
jgi:hypothetical protein